MTQERWQQIVGQIKDSFVVEDFGTEHLDEDGGVDIEYIVFHGPLGLMRLEFEARPVIIGKKTHGSNRIGAHTEVEYQYSDTDKKYELFAFTWRDNEEVWAEVDPKQFS